MVVGDEADSRKKLVMRKKDTIMDLRELNGIKCMDEASKKVLKEGWQKESAQIEQSE